MSDYMDGVRFGTWESRPHHGLLRDYPNYNQEGYRSGARRLLHPGPEDIELLDAVARLGELDADLVTIQNADPQAVRGRAEFNLGVARGIRYVMGIGGLPQH